TVFNTSKQPELARDLIRFVMSSDEAKKYMHASSGQMVPAFERLRADPYWQKNESYRAVLEAPKYARTPGWPGPLTAAAAEVVATNVLTDLCAPRAGPDLPQGRVEQCGLHPGLSGREGRSRHAHGAGAPARAARAVVPPRRAARAVGDSDRHHRAHLALDVQRAVGPHQRHP